MKFKPKEKSFPKAFLSVEVTVSVVLFLSIFVLIGCSSDDSAIAEPSANVIIPLSSETPNIEIPLSYDQEFSS